MRLPRIREAGQVHIRVEARAMAPAALESFRHGVTASMSIAAPRGYSAWPGSHGLPLPISCKHHVELFLPWHRAYLYLFEKSLQDLVPGVTLPWWDWTVEHAEGIPAAYTRRKVDGRKNPLFDSPIQKSGRERPGQARTTRAPGRPGEL